MTEDGMYTYSEFLDMLLEDTWPGGMVVREDGSIENISATVRGSKNNPFTFDEYSESMRLGNWDGGWVNDDGSLNFRNSRGIIVHPTGSGSGSGGGSGSGSGESCYIRGGRDLLYMDRDDGRIWYQINWSDGTACIEGTARHWVDNIEIEQNGIHYPTLLPTDSYWSGNLRLTYTVDGSTLDYIIPDIYLR